MLGVFEAEAKGEKMDRSKFRDFLHKEFGLTEDIMLDRGWYRPSFQGVTLDIIQLKRLNVPQIKLLYTDINTNEIPDDLSCKKYEVVKKPTNKQTKKHVLFSHGKNHCYG